MNPDERPSKRDAFNAFFGEGWVSIHLDARREGVEVPDEFAVNRHLVLQYGQNMPIPIPDLKVDDDGITATLSFSRTPHRTFVPWSAVYIVACNDGRGILYYEDVPEDVSFVARPIDSKTGEPVSATVLETGDGDDAETAEELEDGGEGVSAGADNGQGAGAAGAGGAAAASGEPGAAPGAKRKRPVKRERLLKSVPAEAPSPENDDAEPPPAVARRRKRPQLRVVK